MACLLTSEVEGRRCATRWSRWTIFKLTSGVRGTKFANVWRRCALRPFSRSSAKNGTKRPGANGWTMRRVAGRCSPRSVPSTNASSEMPCPKSVQVCAPRLKDNHAVLDRPIATVQPEFSEYFNWQQVSPLEWRAGSFHISFSFHPCAGVRGAQLDQSVSCELDNT